MFKVLVTTKNYIVAIYPAAGRGLKKTECPAYAVRQFIDLKEIL